MTDHLRFGCARARSPSKYWRDLNKASSVCIASLSTRQYNMWCAANECFSNIRLLMFTVQLEKISSVRFADKLFQGWPWSVKSKRNFDFGTCGYGEDGQWEFLACMSVRVCSCLSGTFSTCLRAYRTSMVSRFAFPFKMSCKFVLQQTSNKNKIATSKVKKNHHRTINSG